MDGLFGVSDCQGERSKEAQQQRSLGIQAINRVLPEISTRFGSLTNGSYYDVGGEEVPAVGSQRRL